MSTSDEQPEEIPDILLPPNHVQRNRHHQGGYRSEDEYMDDMFGRGPGDADFRGYPGQEEATDVD